ncbi:MAG TPA: UDP-3-O-acyl-N-acetylglucosamine deacetylase, partial [Fimbriimonadaceae bacterium]|nr:UDP-3-O-acyl-N-acetylglucosamine deacetylase [Fimbriimonadaceae bacterium]
MSRFPRKTVRECTEFEGKGLHSGEPTTATVHPGESGIVFFSGKTRTPAVPENVTDTSRCTRLGEISTIEHLMSAFAALGVTDAEVEVTGAELPAMDGCALAFFEGLKKLGLQEIGEREVPLPFERVFHVDGEVKIAVSSGQGLWRYEFECGDRWPGSQHFEFSFPGDYGVEVAPARTFAFEEEMEMVRAAGLGRGLDATTAFVIGRTGYVNETRFTDEPARHKLLDLVGDLYLSGIPPVFLNVVSTRSGHRHNVAA